MPLPRPVHVALQPALLPADVLPGSLAVVIDVLRATTTIVHALAAECESIRPCTDLDEARLLANSLKPNKIILGGERGEQRIPGFDLTNSPGEYLPGVCRGATIVFTTTNGTKAIAASLSAAQVLTAAFVNFSAVCASVLKDDRPVVIVCAGTKGEPSLEDTLLAGAIVDVLCEKQDCTLNDSARLAWDSFENHGRVLRGAIEVGRHGQRLLELGLNQDLDDAAAADRFNILPVVKNDPLRIERGLIGVVRRYWPR